MWLTCAVSVESFCLGETEDETWVIKCQVFSRAPPDFPAWWGHFQVSSTESLMRKAGPVRWLGPFWRTAKHWLSIYRGEKKKKKPVHRERSWFCGLNAALVPRRCRFKANFYCRLSEEVWASCLPKLPVCNTGRIILPITPFLSYWDHIPFWEGNIYQLVVT